MEVMPKPRYQYVQRQVTRHGKVVWYFRIGDGQRIRLPGEYGSEEFVKAWKSLIAGETISQQPAGKHTLKWLVDKYQQSAAFRGLKTSTQANRRNILKKACENGGKMLISAITRSTIAAGRDRRADTPHAAINFMKVMGYLFEWAVDAGYAKSNPVKDVKRPKVKSSGFTPWTEEDVIAFYRKHAQGTQERLSLEIMLFTGLRRSDAYRLGPQHIRNEVIEIKATKNGEDLFIPLHPILSATLRGVKSGHMAYIVTPKQGRPFKSAASFGNWFGDACAEAGVSGRAHGIRKQVAQKLAEAGGSNAELKALFGWNSDAMAALYTKGADKRRLAQAAAEKLSVSRDYGEGNG
ncbi:tyrosine-type recombinase/integrase [Rhizobium rhizogenes]|uniref:tyrosine-type recombinase/integrase n=1 Tax=Rhizobium rhizogenes TaxID=359 RepID=UPI0022BBB8C2|nr:tyrosine-type recombinase/integrase [Rhizobium rhizogenes]MCZ7488234.1 tyrosine-type recombinase/integrase [Rhizobium rhizogenes]